MANRSVIARSVFRGIARVQSTFRIQVGPIRATGVPAILVAVSGVIAASGVATLLARNAPLIPETLREARGLAETLRGERPRLKP
ncbi:MAG: hypothetical protein M3R51_09005 [Candidatus Eremiobacteraeota bacterium]|nr:hypothetical protein [Candidatus Eremiobacteraeota bacterium]